MQATLRIATVVLADTFSYVSQALQGQLSWPPFLGQISQSFLLGPAPADGIVDSAVLVTLRAIWLRFCPRFVLRSINADYAFTFIVARFK